jgi:hypothetical protein
LDSSEGGAQYLRQAYVSDEHGEMNLATSSRRSSRYPSMGGAGEIDQIIQKQNRKAQPLVQIMMTSESSEEEEPQRR